MISTKQSTVRTQNCSWAAAILLPKKQTWLAQTSTQQYLLKQEAIDIGQHSGAIDARTAQ